MRVFTVDPERRRWLLDEAINCAGSAGCVDLYGRSVRRRAGLLGREVMAEFRHATGLPVATNMITTNWQGNGARGDAQRGRHSLADPALLDALRRGASRPAVM